MPLDSESLGQSDAECYRRLYFSSVKDKYNYYAQLMEAHKELRETRQALMEYEEMYAKAGLPTKLFGLPVVITEVVEGEDFRTEAPNKEQEPEDSEDQEDEEEKVVYIEVPEGVKSINVTVEF